MVWLSKQTSKADSCHFGRGIVLFSPTGISWGRFLCQVVRQICAGGVSLSDNPCVTV